MTDTEGEFHPVPGIRLAAVPAGIRYRERNDLVLMALPEGANAAAVFTRNAFCAAPVTLARENLASGSPRFLLINSGNANAGTGKQGMTDARACCGSRASSGPCRPCWKACPRPTGRWPPGPS
jgi:glutamate N-acetyltransferase/amino-acid N-acetyltransferase